MKTKKCGKVLLHGGTVYFQKKILLILITFLWLQNVDSQVNGDNPSSTNVNYNDFFVKNIEEPNASTFQEVKLSAANSYTGSANINIPLYTIKEGDITVPISLNYLSTGVKANSVASNVGLNWSLDAGGMVNKVIEGFEDFGLEFGNPIRSKFSDGDDDCNMDPMVINCGSERKLKYDDFKRPADFFYTGETNTKVWLKSIGWFLDQDPLDVKSFLGYESIYVDKILSVEELKNSAIKKDLYPDLFYVNAPGLSTQFTHKKDRTPFEIENSGNKISTSFGVSNEINFLQEFTNDQLHNHIKTFYGSQSRSLTCINNINITNTSGITYDFSDLDVSQHVTRGSEIGLLPQHSAHLSAQEVTAYHLSSIKNKKGNEITFEYQKYAIHNLLPSKSQNYNVKTDETLMATSEPILTDVYYPQLNRLTKINFKGGSVNFYYDLNRQDRPGDKALTRIVIKDSDGKIIKGFKLNYEYFVANTNCSESHCLRLKLTSVREFNNYNETIPPYLFFYNKTKLPELGTQSVDYLGYANGIKSSYDNDRHPTTFISPPSIYYSYNKGRLSFSPIKIFNDSYQINKNGRSLAPNLEYTLAGTLERIKEPTGAEKYFTYELNSFSTPTQKSITAAGLRLKEQRIKDEKGHIKLLESYTYEDEEVFASSSGVLNNMPIYGDVRVNRYYNDTEGIKYGITSGRLAIRVFSSPKNKLKLVQGSNVGYAKVVVKNGINNGKIVRNYYTTNEYPVKEPILYDSHGKVYNMSDRELVDAYKNGGNFPFYNNQDVLLGKLWLEEVFDANNTIVSKKTIQYQYDLLDEIEFRSEIYKSQFVPEAESVADYKLFYHPKIFSHRNLQSIVEDVMMYSDENISQTSYFSYLDKFPFIKEGKTVFNQHDSISTKNYYPTEITSSNILGNTPLTEEEMNAIIVLDTTNQQYIPIQTESYKNEKLLSTQRTNFEISSENFSLPKSIASAKGNKELEKQVEFLHYDTSGNLEEASRIDGAKIKYIWGYHKQYIIAKIEGFNGVYTNEMNALINQIVDASNVDNDRTIDYNGKEGLVRQLLNQLRSMLPDANITSSTYDPLIGVTSVTDPRRKTIYYEYDTFNRLEFVKDNENHILTQYCYNYKGERKKCGYSSVNNDGNDNGGDNNNGNNDVITTDIASINVGTLTEYMIPAPVFNSSFVITGSSIAIPYTWPEIADKPTAVQRGSMHPMFYRGGMGYHHEGNINWPPIAELNTRFYTIHSGFNGALGYLPIHRKGYSFSIADLQNLVNIPDINCNQYDVQSRYDDRSIYVAPDCGTIPNPKNTIENLTLKWYLEVDGEKYPLLKAREIETVFFVPQCLDNKVGKVICDIYRNSDPSDTIYRRIESPEMIFKTGFKDLDNNGPDGCGGTNSNSLPFLLND